MSYSAETIANAFLELARQEGRSLTNMQLQKLVYIAHGFNLALHNEPLFYNQVQAWQWGPVIPKLYQPLRVYGAGEVTDLLPTDEPPVPLDSPQMAVIRNVWDAYGKFSGAQLSGTTHHEGTPWSAVWHRQPYAVIPNDLIAQHYRQLLHGRAATQK